MGPRDDRERWGRARDSGVEKGQEPVESGPAGRDTGGPPHARGTFLESSGDPSRPVRSAPPFVLLGAPPLASATLRRVKLQDEDGSGAVRGREASGVKGTDILPSTSGTLVSTSGKFSYTQWTLRKISV